MHACAWMRACAHYGMAQLPARQCLQVVTAAGEWGTVEGSFGKSGKFKVEFPHGVVQPAAGAPNAITLTFKRFIHDSEKHHMVQ